MKLTIAIPTYDREQKAKKLALKLSKTINNNAEILIVENKSQNMIKFEENELGKIYHVSKTRNQGLDKSIIQILAYTKRKKRNVWIISDD